MARAREKYWLVADKLYVYERHEGETYKLPMPDELRLPTKEEILEFRERLEIDQYVCEKCGYLFWKGGGYGFERDYPENVCPNCGGKGIKRV